jgi:hypothetical protein
VSSYLPVNLDPYCCASAATWNHDRSLGCANAWGNSFPAEELPFGDNLEIAGIPFRLPHKRAADHIECLGQTVSLGAAKPSSGVAFLSFGEMGDQELTVQFHGDAGVSREVKATTREWLIDDRPVEERRCYSCSHLHYPGGYELKLLRPVCWANVHLWDNPALLRKMQLGFNPLFHLFAVTLLDG